MSETGHGNRMKDAIFDLQTIRTILLVELNRFGDVVHALPAARALKRAAPQAIVSMLVEEANHELVALAPFIDCVLPAIRTRTAAGFLETIRAIRRDRFDLVCSLSPVRRNAAVTLASRGLFKAGYLRVWRRIPPHLRRTAVTARGVRLASREEYGSERMGNAAAKVCTALGIHVDPDRVTFKPSHPDSDLIPKNSYIVFHPFAGWKFREWPISLAREFLSRSLRSTDLSIVIIGDASELVRASVLAESPGHEGRVDVRTGLPVAQLIHLISGSVAFVGTDSGPYQLCSLLGKPSVGLFGPNSPEISGSTAQGSSMVYHRLDCSPCAQIRCIVPHASCMARITPEEVLNVVRRMVQE